MDAAWGNAELLRTGRLVPEGRLVEASNTTLLCRVIGDDVEAQCIYKPIAGERPLHDFPDRTLAAREVAAYLLSEAAGRRVVPLTILREGPFGTGMCQWWVEADGTVLVDVATPEALEPGWLPVLSAHGVDGEPVVLAHADVPGLRQLALFDLVINNADRKGGHVLVSENGAVLGVDHGLAFHEEPKLRTVLWGWADTPLTAPEREDLRKLSGLLSGDLGARLGELLTPDEVEAARWRAEALLASGRMPMPDPGRRAIPWPPL